MSADMQEPALQSGGTPLTAFMYGIMAASSSLTGFDAAAHMCEETLNVITAARWSFLLATVVSSVSGLFFIIATCSCLKVGSRAPHGTHCIRGRAPRCLWAGILSLALGLTSAVVERYSKSKMLA